MVIDGFTLFGSWPGSTFDHHADELVTGLERFAVDKACTLSSKGIFFDARAGNEDTWAVCQQHPNLIPIGTTDPRVGGIDQVEFCDTQGFRLLALFPVSQGWSLSGAVARTLFSCLGKTKLPVQIEVGRDGDASQAWDATRDIASPLILLDVSLPTLAEAMAVVRARPNTYLATRLLCGGDTVEYLVREIGADKLIFTSRFPVSCFSSAYLTAKFANIEQPERDAIMGGNMARLLGLA